MNKVSFTAKEVKILICACLAQFISSADNVTTALLIKDIMAYFHVNLSLGQVVTSAYAIVAASLMLISGLLGYTFSWKRIFQVGLLFCLTGELFALFLHDIWLFIIFSRGLMGIGAALILPSCIALLTTQVQTKNKAMAFSIWATSVAIVVSIYPILLTTLNNIAGWRASFAFLAGIAILTFTLSIWIPYNLSEKVKKQFDFQGSLLIVAAVVCFLIAVTFTPSMGFWTAKANSLIMRTRWGLLEFSLPLLLSIISISFCLLFIFIRRDEDKSRRKHSIFPKAFMRKEALAGLYILAFQYVVYGGVLFSLISYISLGPYSKIDLAFAATGFAISMFLTSVIIAVKAKSLSIKVLNSTSLGILAVSIAWLGMSIYAGISINTITLAMVVIGGACGMMATKANIAVNLAVGDEYAEQSSGAQVSAKNIGYVLGVAIFGGLLSSFASSEMGEALSGYITVVDTNVILKAINFMSNEQLSVKLATNGTIMPADLAVINDVVRAVALKKALLLGALFCIISIPIGCSVATEKVH